VAGEGSWLETERNTTGVTPSHEGFADRETPRLQAAERNWEKFKTHLIATEQQAERLYEAAQQAKAEAGMLEGPPADPAAMPGAVAGSVASPGMLADAGAAGGE
jgi:hypothetical protein